MAALQYLYTNSIVKKDYKISVKLVSHFTGFLLILILRALITTDLISVDEAVFEKYISIPVFVYSYTYLYLSINVIRNFHETIVLTRSNFDLYNLQWLKVEIVLLGIFFGTIGVETLSLFVDFGSFYNYVVMLAFFSLLLFINILTFKSLKLPLLPEGITINEGSVLSAEKVKYKRSSITPDKSEKFFLELTNLMKAKKPFKAYIISLAQLSEMLDLTPSEVSQIINENSRMNFNDFINKYRVEEAKKLFLDHKDWLIKEIMYESGFQSTSTFNSAFKKFTGMSPTKFRKQQD
jgi:AraC-like DNA-binding protein